jgi:hypothetical protein
VEKTALLRSRKNIENGIAMYRKEIGYEDPEVGS